MVLFLNKNKTPNLQLSRFYFWKFWNRMLHSLNIKTRTEVCCAFLTNECWWSSQHFVSTTHLSLDSKKNTFLSGMEQQYYIRKQQICWKLNRFVHWTNKTWCTAKKNNRQICCVEMWTKICYNNRKSGHGILSWSSAWKVSSELKHAA